MGRSRVLSFISQFGGPPRSPPQAASSPAPRPDPTSSPLRDVIPAPTHGASTPPRTRTERSSSRPMSMVQTYQPPLLEVAHDTIPELQPIFSYLNSHSNKLYQEGYFLKLNDLDSNGRPNADRTWTECFAQLSGTVLSLWDAAALDSADREGEVVPSFINLTDACITMIETLPTRSDDGRPLQNVLSVSTAGKNRYLLHFSSLHSLTQWTAGIRLAMFEHTTLQELYTGSLIAGKGKMLNNIRGIMERTRVKTEDWVRVRFGAGTPWRRCWCVITPPDEKAYQKLQRQTKRRSVYERVVPPRLTGDIKFYDSKKTKKVTPIASITDAYGCHAIYPQSKPLIDQSTLIKVEGTITIHTQPSPTTTEGFVFVMPEVHPAVSGFEMMLRWLFPAFDTFGLYGRPERLIADTMDVRGLMFAMPNDRRYGYLEILDVAGLIHTEGSQKWKEADWRRNMKELTAKRIKTLMANGGRQGGRSSTRRAARTSLQLPSRSTVQFDDDASIRSSPVTDDKVRSEGATVGSPQKAGSVRSARRTSFPLRHRRSVSEAQGLDRRLQEQTVYDAPPRPPPHALGTMEEDSRVNHSSDSNDPSNGGGSGSESDVQPADFADTNAAVQGLPPSHPPEPVAAPPAFAHGPGARPVSKPYHSADQRWANTRMSTTTLSQITGMNSAAAAAAAAWRPGNANATARFQENDMYPRRKDGVLRRTSIQAGQQEQGVFQGPADGELRGVYTDSQHEQSSC